MELKAGTTMNDSGSSELDNSMAKAIEDAFLKEWPKIMGDGSSAPESNDQMRLLFIAIAQGVIRHLHDNPDAFQVSFTFAGIPVSGQVSQIQSTGVLY